MRHARLPALVVAALVLLLGAPAPASAATAERRPAHPYLTGRVLVRYRPTVSATTRRAAALRHGARQVRRLPALHVDVLAPRNPAATLAALRARRDVVWAEPEVLAQRFAEITSTPERTELQVAAAHTAQPLTRGNNEAVAIIDDGVWSVTDLAGRLYDRGDCSSGTCAATGAVNADAGSHGTAVATIVAAADNDTGIIGVAPLARIFAYRVFPDAQSGASDTAIASAIMKAADDNAAVANLSLGTPFDSRLLRDAIAYARAKRPTMVIVAAAGNDGSERASYPAGDATVVSVGAAQPCSASWCVTGFSTRGDVDVIAPGANVRAWYTGDPGPPSAPSPAESCTGDTESCLFGTSFAAPQVAGILAGLAGAGIRGDRARAAVLASAVAPGGSDPASASGQGRAKMHGAYALATGTTAYNAVFVDRGAYVARTVGRRTVEAIRVDPQPGSAPDGAPTVTAAAGTVSPLGSATPSGGTAGVTVHRELFSYAAPASGTSTTLSSGAAGDTAESVPLALLPPNGGPEGEPMGGSLPSTSVFLQYGTRSSYIRSVSLPRGARLSITFAYPAGSEYSLLFLWLPAAVTGGGGATDPPIAVDTSGSLNGTKVFVAPVSGRYTFGFLLFDPTDTGTYTISASVASGYAWQQLPTGRRPTGGLR